MNHEFDILSFAGLAGDSSWVLDEPELTELRVVFTEESLTPEEIAKAIANFAEEPIDVEWVEETPWAIRVRVVYPWDTSARHWRHGMHQLRCWPFQCQACAASLHCLRSWRVSERGGFDRVCGMPKHVVWRGQCREDRCRSRVPLVPSGPLWGNGIRIVWIARITCYSFWISYSV